jgi:hypothetical protein
MSEIKIQCDGTIFLRYSELNEFQDDIKTISRSNIEKLKSSIIDDGFKAPIFVWKNNNKYYLLDGHQRKKALAELNEDFGIPEIPCVEVFAKSRKEAKANVLLFTSQHGEFDTKKLDLYIQKYKINPGNIVLRKSQLQLGKSLETIYTQKIKPPTYEPTGKKPKIKDLCDQSKVNQLIEKINESNVSAAEKQFLIMAAYRHTVFSYQDIAEYYAQSEKEMQELMEDSALIIIDFNKAIANGYVTLSEEVAAQYMEENEDE